MTDRRYLEYVLSRIERIGRYTQGGRGAFLDDDKTQDAVLRNLHTLAESTQRASDDLEARHPEVDWRAIAGFRNVVVHDYLGMDPEQVWRSSSATSPSSLGRSLRGWRRVRGSGDFAAASGPCRRSPLPQG